LDVASLSNDSDSNSTRGKDAICHSDINGNFVTNNTSISHIVVDQQGRSNNMFRTSEKANNNVLVVKIVSFQYQLQTSLLQTSVILQEDGSVKAIEKRMSDVLVAYLFGDGDHCYVISQRKRKKDNINKTIQSVDQPNEIENDDHRKIRMRMKSNATQISSRSDDNDSKQVSTKIVGISASPLDEIVPGIDGGKFLTFKCFRAFIGPLFCFIWFSRMLAHFPE
jgi:hypothetical protein